MQRLDHIGRFQWHFEIFLTAKIPFSGRKNFKMPLKTCESSKPYIN